MIALTAQEIAPRLAALTGWQIEEGELTRTFSFKDFLAALAFVNRVGEQAEKAGHHPDIDIRYNKVSLWLVTHDAGAPSDRSSILQPSSTGCSDSAWAVHLAESRAAILKSGFAIPASSQ